MSEKNIYCISYKNISNTKKNPRANIVYQLWDFLMKYRRFSYALMMSLNSLRSWSISLSCSMIEESIL